MNETLSDHDMIEHYVSILNELSTIRISLTENTTETRNIKSDISNIKDSIKEIRDNYIPRREFDDAFRTIREEISPLRRFVYGIIGTISLFFLGAILNLFHII